MKPEDKVTTDRLTAAGTTQTPLTDAICPLGLWRDNTAPHYVIELAGHARSLELALAASRAREAELVKVLKRYVEWFGPCHGTFPEEGEKNEQWDAEAQGIDDQVSAAIAASDAALTAPPTNSKEMNK